MKIAIINLTAGGISGGYKKYLQNIIPRMSKHPEVEAIFCASPKTLNVQDWLKSLTNVEFANCSPFRFMHHNPDSKLKMQLKKFAPDIIFVPLERYFKYDGVPFVTMIQNMAPLVSNIKDNLHREKLRYKAQTIEAKIAIKKADRIIAISNFVKEFLLNKWHVSADKICKIYFGTDSKISVDSKKPSFIPENWENRFIFTAGSIDPFRGLEDILSAINLMSLQKRELKLVIAGNARESMLFYYKKLKDLLEKNNIASQICWTGYLNEEEIIWCYQNCCAFIMTSRVEACPNIVLEAMANGCVCISTDNPPMPEFFNDAAIYYPAMSGKALAEAIQRVLTWNDDKHKEISEKAKKRASQFSWDVCAERTVAELKKTILNHRSTNI